MSAEYCTVSGPGLKVCLSASNYSAGVPANDRMSATLSMSSHECHADANHLLCGTGGHDLC